MKNKLKKTLMSERLTRELYDGINIIYETKPQDISFVIEKLGKVEDFMEEYGFNSIDDLKEEFLIAELQAYKKRWEKLKEYVTYLKNYSTSENGEEGKCLFDGENITNDILDKMKELEEGGDEE